MMNPKQQKRPSIKAQTKVKKKISKRKNGTLRVQLDFSDTVSRTKQEFVNEVNINNIVKLPLPPQQPLTYGDISNPPDLAKVFDTIHTVKENFLKLPSDIRRLMDNDPAKMQAFILDPKNTELLVTRGVLTLPPQTEEPKEPAVVPSASSEPALATKEPSA